jgi:hypothetical protein
MLVSRCPLRFRRLAPIIVYILAASMFAPNVHAQKRAVGGTKVGRIAPMSPGGLVPGSETLSPTLVPEVQTFIDAWVEYNTSTCVEISAGSWTVTTAPKYGTTATGTVTGTLGNGDCAGVTFTFAAIYYTWTSTNPKVDTDTFAATWTSPDYQEMDTVDITECGGPTIMFNGANVAEKTTSAAVGQEIMLTGQAPNAACVSATASQQWSMPSSTNAVGGYTATASPPNAAVTPLPTDTTSTSYGPFYWISPATYTMTYQYTLTNGETSPVSTAKFKVGGPKEVKVYTCGGSVPPTGCTNTTALGTVVITPGPALGFGDATYSNTGIQFTASATAPPGDFSYVQEITNDVITETPSDGSAVQTCYPLEVPTPGVFPGLDTSYPYSTGATTTDNPGTGTLTNVDKKVSRAFSAQMYLLWTPTAAADCTGGASCTIPVPLGSVSWRFNAAAKLTNSALDTWTVTSGKGSAKAFVASNSYPTWTSWVEYGGMSCH